MSFRPRGYGRYKDAPGHVGCPRARSDMTPCIARGGALALADDDVCVGCGVKPWDELVALKKEAKLSPPSRSQGPGHFADQLQEIVYRLTDPDATRALREGERKAAQQARIEFAADLPPSTHVSPLIFEAGFIAGLRYRDAQVEDLEARLARIDVLAGRLDGALGRVRRGASVLARKASP